MKQKNNQNQDLDELTPEERQILVTTLGGCAMTCVVFLLIMFIIGAIAYLGKS